jgi:hypothetical protein
LHQVTPEIFVVVIQGYKAVDLDGNYVVGVWLVVWLDVLLEHHAVTQMVSVGAHLLPFTLGHGDLGVWSI